MRAFVLLFFFVLVMFCGPERALADTGSCTASASAVNFGNLSVGALANASTSGNATANCSAVNTGFKQWTFCLNIGIGSNSASQTNRTMKSSNGVYRIAYQLYTNAAMTNLYTFNGNAFVYAPWIATAGATANIPIYAKILSTGTGVAPGLYTDVYATGAQAAINNDGTPPGSPTAASECNGLSSAHWWNAVAFTVSVNVASSCSVTASDLNFGAVGVLTSITDASSALTISCTLTTPYTVSLSAGNGSGATTTTRFMTKGGDKIAYRLYRDAARTLNWGNDAASGIMAGTGSGAAQIYNVYGRVTPQTTPSPGTYSDTIVVNVNY